VRDEHRRAQRVFLQIDVTMAPLESGGTGSFATCNAYTVKT
jgi:hypothetical protein